MPRTKPPKKTPSDRSDAAAIDLVMKLMAIRGASGNEGEVADTIRKALRKAGAPTTAISTDRANQKTPLRGQVGNLIFRLPGTVRGPRRLLMAHMDTVPICVGSQPRRKGRTIDSADPQTGLGADDRAGVAVVLTTALNLLKSKQPHPPLTFLWTIQEEIGLHGARLLALGKLGRPKLAFNFDGGSPAKLTTGATGGYRMAIKVHGVAAHAGGAPEQGVSAISIAALAIADLQKNGWHGAIRKGRRQGTSNVGVIEGGAATNVVTDSVFLRVEARSHDPVFRKQIVKAIEDAFRKAARSVRNIQGQAGRIEFQGNLDYDSFRLADDEPSVVAAHEAIVAEGGTPLPTITDGGVDANWMSARGVPTVTLGCGQRFQHTVKEQLDIDDFLLACRIAKRLATAS